MEKYLLIALVVIILGGLIAYHLYEMARGKSGVGLAKDAPADPPGMIDEGVVVRIGTVSSEWGPTVHILLEEKPGSPIAFSFDTNDSAIALTQPGDRIRLEREDADSDEYVFVNLTTGLTATGE
jgi:hypothetical protein